jgi:hypothetical protein
MEKKDIKGVITGVPRLVKRDSLTLGCLDSDQFQTLRFRRAKAHWSLGSSLLVRAEAFPGGKDLSGSLIVGPAFSCSLSNVADLSSNYLNQIDSSLGRESFELTGLCL